MTQIKVKFFKVTGLPSECEANSVYYVKNGDFIESYITDAGGSPSPSSNSAMINALIEAANLAPLDGNGKLNPAVIPVLKSHEFVVVANQAARLLLTVNDVQPGDEAFELDSGKTYTLIATNPTQSGSWRFKADTTPDWAAIANKPALGSAAEYDKDFFVLAEDFQPITTYSPDKLMPGSPLVYDDFLGNALDVDWTQTANPPVIQVGQSLCNLSGNGSASWRLRGVNHALTQQNDFTAICKLAHKSSDVGNAHIGMFFLTSNDEYLFVGLSDGCFTASVRLYATDLITHGDLTSGSLGDGQRINYLKVHIDDGGNVYLYVSNDGIRWISIHSIEGDDLTLYSVGIGVISRGDSGNQTGSFDWVGIYSGFVDIIGG